MTTKKKADAQDAPYEDVSKHAEKAANAQPDEDGQVDAKTAEASAKVDAEVTHRAAGAGEGGGPWPEEVLRKRFLQTPETGYVAPDPE